MISINVTRSTNGQIVANTTMKKEGRTTEKEKKAELMTRKQQLNRQLLVLPNDYKSCVVSNWIV